MSEENNNGNQSEQTAKIEELTTQIATLTADKNNVVGELQEDRKKRQELQDEITTLKEALENATKGQQTDPNDTATMVAQLVEKKLNERDASVAKGNKTAAIERFTNEHKEFHPDNDTTGARREALMKALARFNTEGLVSESDFYGVVKDAARLLGPNTDPVNPSEPTQVPSGPAPSNQPKTVDVGAHSEKEKKLMEKHGMSAERFDKLKARDPKYIENLLRYVN